MWFEETERRLLLNSALNSIRRKHLMEVFENEMDLNSENGFLKSVLSVLLLNCSPVPDLAARKIRSRLGLPCPPELSLRDVRKEVKVVQQQLVQCRVQFNTGGVCEASTEMQGCSCNGTRGWRCNVTAPPFIYLFSSYLGHLEGCGAELQQEIRDSYYELLRFLVNAVKGFNALNNKYEHP